MKSLITIIKEHINNFYLISRLSLYEVKTTNNNNYLGMLWEIINPGIQIFIYWFVFGYVLERGAVEGIAYFPWMVAGYVLWFFVQPSIIKGSKSIYTRINMVSKMSFPMSVIPTYIIVSNLYTHLLLLTITGIILQFLGYGISWYYIQIPYFIIATFILLVSITLITSTLTTIVRDFQMIIQSIMRMLLYMTPILWSSSHLSSKLQLIMNLNPFNYLVQGYRTAFLGQGWYLIEHWESTIYFWVLVFIFLLIGSSLHLRFRKHFIDFI
ncbi:teichoic acid ABC transporter permease [Niallia circulans]|uniref:ABC transporter permease n=1 Tax=Niallia circulans TaxID=1397 RepID=UPI00201E3237|nr:ABC transporter permease [Niallia circulans]UQZ76032.1 teichoic acid ABC transporter permease [Niallia circulans]